MKDLLIYLAQNLVTKPDQVTVDDIEKDEEILFEVRVAPEDMGKIIGRQGRIAKEIRTIMKAAGLKTGKKITVDIVD